MENIEYIKKHYNIIDIAKRLGIQIINNNKAICPFHNDTNPSLSFNIKYNYYHCFSCGASGDNIKLVREILNYDFKQSIEFIIGKEYKTILYNDRSKSVELNSNYNQIYRTFINLLDNEDAIKYLEKRRISKYQVINHNIKNIPIEKDKQFAIIKKLLKYYNEEDLLKSGIVSKSKNYQTLYLFHFKHRLIIPYFDTDGIKINAIQGRVIDNNNTAPKYLFNLNSKDSIYNINTLNENKDIVLCEGVIDCLSLERLGYTSIAISGATKSNLISSYDILKKYNIYIFSDNDEAGEKLIKKLYKLDNYKGKFLTNKFTNKKIKDINELLMTIEIKTFMINNIKYEYFNMPNDKICILDYYIFNKYELKKIKNKENFHLELCLMTKDKKILNILEYKTKYGV